MYYRFFVVVALPSWGLFLYLLSATSSSSHRLTAISKSAPQVSPDRKRQLPGKLNNFPSTSNLAPRFSAPTAQQTRTNQARTAIEQLSFHLMSGFNYKKWDNLTTSDSEDEDPPSSGPRVTRLDTPTSVTWGGGGPSVTRPAAPQP